MVVRRDRYTGLAVSARRNATSSSNEHRDDGRGGPGVPLAHDLEADSEWDAYCDGVGEKWLSSQGVSESEEPEHPSQPETAARVAEQPVESAAVPPRDTRTATPAASRPLARRIASLRSNPQNQHLTERHDLRVSRFRRALPARRGSKSSAVQETLTQSWSRSARIVASCSTSPWRRRARPARQGS